MIAIVGQGHLGKYLHENLGGSTLLPDRLETITVSQLEGYRYVVNTAAKTDLSWCQNNKKEAYAINVLGALDLQHKTMQAGARFIQLSSGCIWDGPFNHGEPFGPTDTPTPASYYAVTKAEADERLLGDAAYAKNTAILRLRMPYSPVNSPRNLFHKLCQYKEVIDDPNTITSADTLCKTIQKLVDGPTELWSRVSLVYDWGVTSPYHIATRLYQAGLREPPSLLQKNDLDTWHFPKRVSTVMFDEVFEREINPPHVNEELGRVIALYKENRNHR